MAVPLTGDLRKSGKTNEERSKVTRERVLDMLMQMGGRHGDPVKLQAARDEFCTTAVRIGRERGMRLWKDESATVVDGAHSSLAVLLCEKRVVNKGTIATGVNSAWVLDLWEAALDYYFRDPVWGHHRASLTLVGAPATTDEEIDALNADGPTVFAKPVVPPAAKSLSMRLLEAYLAKDDEQMMAIAVEVESLETSG